MELSNCNDYYGQIHIHVSLLFMTAVVKAPNWNTISSVSQCSLNSENSLTVTALHFLIYVKIWLSLISDSTWQIEDTFIRKTSENDIRNDLRNVISLYPFLQSTKSLPKLARENPSHQETFKLLEFLKTEWNPWSQLPTSPQETGGVKSKKYDLELLEEAKFQQANNARVLLGIWQ